MEVNGIEVPGFAAQVYAGWVWMIGSDELRWSKRATERECENVVREVVERRGIDALTND